MVPYDDRYITGAPPSLPVIAGDNCMQGFLSLLKQSLLYLQILGSVMYVSRFSIVRFDTLWIVPPPNYCTPIRKCADQEIFYRGSEG